MMLKSKIEPNRCELETFKIEIDKTVYTVGAELRNTNNR